MQYLVITPHKVVLLKFTTLLVTQAWPPIISHRLTAFLVDQVTTVKSLTEPTLNELLSSFDSFMPRQNATQDIKTVIMEMVKSIESPDSVVQLLKKLFFDLVETDSQKESDIMRAPLKLEGTTVLSGFVIEARAVWTTSPFTAMSRLWEEFLTYNNPETGGFRGLKSAIETRVYLDGEAERIEASIGYLSRQEITAQLALLNATEPQSIHTHFLAYLACLHHNDYQGSIDALHQYFDYALLDSRLATMESDGTKSSSAVLLPYAILNLAAVHLRFGHINEALELIKEALRDAQPRKDDVSLTRTLALLYRLAEHRCDHSIQRQLVKRTLARGMKLLMSSLTAQTMVDLAKHELLHPRALNGLDAILSQSTAPIPRPSAVWRLINASISAATRSETDTASAQLTSSALLMSSRAWDLYGNSDMSKLAAQIQLHIHNGPNEQHLNSSQGSDIGPRFLNSADACTAMCTLADNVSACGDETRALQILLEAKRLYPLPTSQAHWIRVCRQLLQEWALQRGDLQTAEIQAVQLAALTPLNLELHHHVDALYRLAVTMMHQGFYVQSQNMIQSLISVCESTSLKLQSVGFLLTLAEIRVRSGSPITAVEPLLSCISLSEQFGLKTIHTIASVQLANVHLLLGSQLDALKAQALVDSVMPHVLHHCSDLVQAQAKVVSVKAMLAVRGAEDSLMSQESIKDAEVWNLALLETEDVITLATELNNTDFLKEGYYLKSRLYHAMGMHIQRNNAARSFRQLMEQSSKLASVFPGGISFHYYLNEKTLEQELERISLLSFLPNLEP